MTPCVEFQAPAIVEWTLNDETHHLGTVHVGKGVGLTLDCRLYDDETSLSYFQLCIPIELKGLGSKTLILVPLYLEAIYQLTAEIGADVPPAVLDQLNCSCTCLHVELNQPPHLVVPDSAASPLQPHRAASGKIMDALRSLLQVVAFDVYVPEKSLSLAKLDAMKMPLERDVVKPPTHDLATLFKGAGGRVVTCLDESPPLYQQIEPSPPLVEESKSRKRRRQKSVRIADDARLDAIWAELTKKDEQICELRDELDRCRQEMRERHDQHRREMRERDNRHRQEIQDKEDRIRTLEEQSEYALDERVDRLEDEIYQWKNKNEGAAGVREEMDDRIVDMDARVAELEDDVDFIKKTGIDRFTEERIRTAVAKEIFKEARAENCLPAIVFQRQAD